MICLIPMVAPGRPDVRPDVLESRVKVLTQEVQHAKGEVGILVHEFDHHVLGNEA